MYRNIFVVSLPVVKHLEPNHKLKSEVVSVYFKIMDVNY